MSLEHFLKASILGKCAKRMGNFKPRHLTISKNKICIYIIFVIIEDIIVHVTISVKKHSPIMQRIQDKKHVKHTTST